MMSLRSWQRWLLSWLVFLAGTAQAGFVIPPWVPIFRGIEYTAAETDPNEVSQQKVMALRIDLTDPTIEFFSTPDNGDGPLEAYGQTTTAFVQAYGVKAAVNANFFSPVSTTPNDPRDLSDLAISRGVVVSPPEGLRDLVLLTRSNQATFTATAPASLSNYWTAVAGSDLLVTNGVNAINPDCATSFCGPNPRTAVGASADGRYFYMIVIDGRQPGWSDGATLLETGNWLIRLGAWRGVNLDGGGSSTMSKIENGAPILLNRPSGGIQRVNGNHLGVFASNLPPVIVMAPTNQTPLIGQPATLKVLAGGTTPLRYQWLFQGAPIAGATGSSLAFTNTMPVHSGTYTVVLSNSYGVLTSAPVTFTPHYALATSASLGGILTRSPDQPSLPPNAAVTLTALPDPGFVFAAWSGDIVGTNNPLTLVLTTHRTVAATFVGSVPDLILDNTNAVLAGAWTTNTTPSGYYGSHYLTAPTVAATNAPNRTATYVPRIYTPGRYATYVWHPPDATRSTNAPWKIAFDGGTNSVVVNQAANGGSWRLLTTGRDFARGTNAWLRVANNASRTNRVVADAIRLTYGFPPALTASPADTTVVAGNSVALTAAASGSLPLAFQWQLRGTNLPGATSSNLAFPTVQAAHAGPYSVRVSNLFGLATSAVALLNVRVPAYLTKQPASQLAHQGTNVTFTASAAGDTPLFYQWRYQGADLPGATNTSFTRTNVQAADAGSYTVAVSNSVGSATSSNALLTVSPAPAPPRITSQPAHLVAIAGRPALFRVAANGTLPFGYQWFRNNLPLPDTSQPELRLPQPQPPDNGSYHVVITNVAGAVTSSAVTLNVQFILEVVPPFGGTVTRTPDLPSYPPGTVIALAATPDAGFTFNTWGGNLVSTTSSVTFPLTTNRIVGALFAGSLTNLVLDNPGAEYTGSWTVGTSSGDKYSSNYHYATTATGAATASATYRPLITTPGRYQVSILYPQGSNRASNALWTVLAASGSVSTQVNQKINGGRWVPLADDVTFARGTNGLVRLDNLSDTAGSVVMADAIRIAPLAEPRFIQWPRHLVVFPGDPAVFSATISGATPISCQWRRQDAPLAQATSLSYLLPAATPGDAGPYTLTLSNAYGWATSPPARLVVLDPPSAPPQLESLVWDPLAGLRLHISGGTNHALDLEASTNLTHWTVLTNLPPPDGPVELLDPSATQGLRRFYRARWRPQPVEFHP